jgi:hypothetical protein
MSIQLEHRVEVEKVMTAPTSPMPPGTDLPAIAEADLRAALAAAWAAASRAPGNLDAVRIAVQMHTNLSRDDAVRVALYVERTAGPVEQVRAEGAVAGRVDAPGSATTTDDATGPPRHAHALLPAPAGPGPARRGRHRHGRG